MKRRSLPFRTLLAEDNPGDARLTRESIRDADTEVKVTVTANGESALSLMAASTNASMSHLPDIILLDLNLPGMNGMDVQK